MNNTIRELKAVQEEREAIKLHTMRLLLTRKKVFREFFQIMLDNDRN